MRVSFPLPLWERVVSSVSEGEGYFSDRLGPLTRLEFAALILATLSHKGRGEKSRLAI